MVEGASLENWSTGNCTGGSNPSLSAITLVIYHLQAGDTYTDTRIRKGHHESRSESH